jgi:hypothetical protein
VPIGLQQCNKIVNTQEWGLAVLTILLAEWFCSKIIAANIRSIITPLH